MIISEWLSIGYNLQKADHEVKDQICDLQIITLQIAEMEKHQRLRLARERKFETAKDAAVSLGVNEKTYGHHESGTRGFKEDSLKLYARRFGVPIEWLALGRGKPASEHTSWLRIDGRIGAGAQIDTGAEQAPANAEEVEVKVGLPAGTVGFEVYGDSMWPRYENGDLVVCLEAGVPLSELRNGQEAAVQTEDGLRYLKKVWRADQDGLFNLESHNAAPIKGVKLIWAAAVEVIVPRDKR